MPRILRSPCGVGPALLSMLILVGVARTGYGQDVTPLFTDSFQINLWPGGIVPYTYAYNEIDVNDRLAVESQIRRLNDRFALPDPANSARRIQHIRFELCDGFFTPPCPDQHLEIRNNRPGEGEGDDVANTCRYDPPDPHIKGSNPNGLTFMRIARGTGPNTIVHELLHCLGVWHEFNRYDAETWLVDRTPLYESRTFSSPTRLMPLLGNFDYDSVMLYGSYADGHPENLLYRDRKENAFRRTVAPLAQVPSSADMSRVLQYYAHERQPHWGFFFSLNMPPARAGDMPGPYLAPNVSAVGSPAIVYRGLDDFDLFVRGSDERIYWKWVSTNFSAGAGSIPTASAGSWTSLGCCFGSEPAAISRVAGEIDVVAIGAITGKLQRNRLQDGRWQGWSYIADGFPPGGLKTASHHAIRNGGYIGPAIAARSTLSLDVFVVQEDGLLAVTTLSGAGWSDFVTIGQGYVVTARPAALAMSPSSVRLAINEDHINLYEPVVSFPPTVASIRIQLGDATATMARDTPPALTRRTDADDPYRVLITNADGRLAHRFANGGWRDIGGIPQSGSGPAAVSTGGYGALILINGEDVKGCKFTCIPGDSPRPDRVIQPGGLWLRRFR